MRKIIFNDIEMIVEDAYAYIYDYGKGKTVLRIRVSESNATFDDILKLKDLDADISYYIQNRETDEYELKDVYSGYTYDFTANYAKGEYNIEITRQGKTELAVSQLEAAADKTTSEIETLTLALAEILYN